MTATVGDNCDEYYQENNPLVIAIFEGNPYKICLTERGVKSGEPIFVGEQNIVSQTNFE
ncbi:hypothetical protein [uncultured Bacteroides sp.]|uniref:hypothetical protein n=1 Tax=uncultured Bacteroides sp. TaxID=162156 RepID=UPI002AA8314F|nr:hypothetical protein [uncultured Bacteroides sp.]